jgi:hypothetical protein
MTMASHGISAVLAVRESVIIISTAVAHISISLKSDVTCACEGASSVCAMAMSTAVVSVGAAFVYVIAHLPISRVASVTGT